MKGTAWRRSGIFERLAVVQGEQTFRLAAADHRLIEELAADGAPELREAGLFALRADSGFRPTGPWRLQVLIEGRDASGGKVSAVAELLYQLPARPDPARRRPRPRARRPALWQAVWLRRAVDIGVLVAALGCLTAILFFQDQLAQRPRLWRRVRIGFLLFTLLWLGWYATAQLSVVNVLTFGEALRTGFRWEFFLLEPLIFILWSYVAVALVFWGRGAFCGWLCPFGALQELTNQAARRLGVPQLAIPFWLHERLRTASSSSSSACSPWRWARWRRRCAWPRSSPSRPRSCCGSCASRRSSPMRSAARGGEPGDRALLLPLSVPARCGAGAAGPAAPVRVAEAALAVRARVPDLRDVAARCGRSSPRA